MINKSLALPEDREGILLPTIPWEKFLGAIDAFTGAGFDAGTSCSPGT